MSDAANDKAIARIDPRALTPARIGLDRTGVSVTTRHLLEFAQAHGAARDAVHAKLAVPIVLAALRERGLEALAVKSAAADRAEYLRRPDLGRTLAPASLAALREHSSTAQGSIPGEAKIAIVLADGLSALAAERHALPLLDALLPMLRESAWSIAPIVVAEQARVALGDAVSEAMHADLAVVLIGERPGLSSPDSLGAYITWKPRVGCTDAERNCVSNIHTAGLGYGEAAARIAWYGNAGRHAGRTGVELQAGLPDAARALPGSSGD